MCVYVSALYVCVLVELLSGAVFLRFRLFISSDLPQPLKLISYVPVVCCAISAVFCVGLTSVCSYTQVARWRQRMESTWFLLAPRFLSVTNYARASLVSSTAAPSSAASWCEPPQTVGRLETRARVCLRLPGSEGCIVWFVCQWTKFTVAFASIVFFSHTTNFQNGFCCGFSWSRPRLFR